MVSKNNNPSCILASEPSIVEQIVLLLVYNDCTKSSPLYFNHFVFALKKI